MAVQKEVAGHAPTFDGYSAEQIELYVRSIDENDADYKLIKDAAERKLAIPSGE